MKTIFKTLVITVFLFGCESISTCGCDIAPNDELSGKWRLVKQTFGFPAPNMPTSTTKVEDEVYEIDVTKLKYSLTKKEKQIESGTISLEESNNGGYIEKTINFQPSNTYSIYSFSADKKQLILYQRSPIGARLADGSSFYYEKVSQ